MLYYYPFLCTLGHWYTVSRQSLTNQCVDSCSAQLVKYTGNSGYTCNIHCIQEKKHQLAFFLHLPGKCLNLYKFSGNVCDETGMPLTAKLNIHCC